MGALIVSSLIAIAFAVAGVCWFKIRIDKVRIDDLTAKLATAALKLTWTEGERDAARRAWKAAEAENAKLRELNDLLSHLGGKVASSWPTP